MTDESQWKSSLQRRLAESLTDEKIYLSASQLAVRSLSTGLLTKAAGRSY